MAPGRRLAPAVVAWAVAGVVMLGAWLVLGHVALSSDPADSVCLLRRSIGLACPTCGMTRSLALLARDRPLAALEAHPLGPPFVAETILLWIWWGEVARGRRQAPPASRLGTLMIANAAVFATVWIVRLATGTLPP